MEKDEARSLATQIIAGKYPDLWDALCEVYEVDEDTCTISQFINILEDEDPEMLSPFIS